MARTVSPNHHMPSKRIQALTGVQAYRRTGVQAYRRTGVQAYRRTGLWRFVRVAVMLRSDIKSQDLGPRQPAKPGKVVVANAGCG
jgi:hypothetical protein